MENKNTVQTNSEIILGILMAGERIEMYTSTMCLNDEYQLCSVWHPGEKNEEIVPLGSEIEPVTLSDFIKWCENMSDVMVTKVIEHHALDLVVKLHTKGMPVKPPLPDETHVCMQCCTNRLTPSDYQVQDGEFICQSCWEANQGTDQNE
jgi:hypothetical protein